MTSIYDTAKSPEPILHASKAEGEECKIIVCYAVMYRFLRQKLGRFKIGGIAHFPIFICMNINFFVNSQYLHLAIR
jgi:hypothetical protein